MTYSAFPPLWCLWCVGQPDSLALLVTSPLVTWPTLQYIDLILNLTIPIIDFFPFTQHMIRQLLQLFCAIMFDWQ